jgi:CubicO group peptidase (beta-lactamase class C family)
LCFHSFTYGILTGELVRRVDGRSLPQFFEQELARPLEIDLQFALEDDVQSRCAELVLPQGNALFRLMTDPATTLGRSWQPMPWAELNSPQFRRCDFPSIGAHGSALGLARFYAAMACAGVLGGRRMLDESITREALREQHHGPDAFMGAPVRMGLGFMLHNHVFRFTGSAGSFGQPGLGGIAGVGDADARIGIGITCNLLNGAIENPLLDRLLQRIVEGV